MLLKIFVDFIHVIEDFCYNIDVIEIFCYIIDIIEDFDLVFFTATLLNINITDWDVSLLVLGYGFSNRVQGSVLIRYCFLVYINDIGHSAPDEAC